MGGFQPAADLLDGVGQRSRRIVNAGMGDDGQELMQARPGDRPLGTAFGQLRDDLIRLGMPGRIGTVGMDQDIGVEGDQVLAHPIDEVPQLLPIAFRNAPLESFAFEDVPPQAEPARRPVREPQPQGLFHHGTKRAVFFSRPGFGFVQQVISNNYGSLHMANHIIMPGSRQCNSCVPTQER